MKIADFSAKWDFYVAQGRAQRISPTYFPNRAAIQKERVALRFPSRATDAFPVSDLEASSMEPQAFSNWLRGNLPRARETSFAILTGLPLETWGLPLADFQAAVRRAAGEAVSWAALLKAAILGAIAVQVHDPEPVSRFNQVDTPSPASPPTPAWAGCLARVGLPRLDLRQGDWRAWLVADYGAPIFVLDPMRQKDGEPSASRLTQAMETLPRWGALTINAYFPPGTTFDTVVLLFDLADQPDAIISCFDQLERRLMLQPAENAFAATTYLRLRQVLDEAATLMGDHGVKVFVYRQPCLVIQKPRTR